MWNSVILLFLVFSPSCLGLELITAATGLAGGLASVLWMTKDKVYCQFKECCQEPYVRSNPYGLQNSLEENLFGQHIAKSIVLKSIRSHLTKFRPKKALVLSFHGMTGSGKNYVSQLIAESLFKEGMKSKYVSVYISKVHFPDITRVEEYKLTLQKEIKEKVSACERSLFIFDEIDDLHPGIIDAIKPFLDYHPLIDGVDYRKTIFIFLSNTGASKIYSITSDHWKSSKERELLTLEDFDEVLNSAAYNSKGGLRRTDIIEKALLDASIPFLPMEKEHVKLCIKAELDKQRRQASKEEEELGGDKEISVKTYTDDHLTALAELRSYDKDGVFSKMGCKKLETLVAAFLMDD
eukprot:TRINITY_DN1771_c0_g1_i1.p1 TRINITY_DN1771_c0_g1~~TRINITY_DN1771_c0_g1_i1.p1  ORF type:complete len:351 (-),score=70.21 TRINITY_DN1771_c0_g1_i1:692-1744(-)